MARCRGCCVGISTFYRSGWLPGLQLGGLTTQPEEICSKKKKNGPIAMTYLIVKFDIAIGPFFFLFFLTIDDEPQHTCSKKKKKE